MKFKHSCRACKYCNLRPDYMNTVKVKNKEWKCDKKIKNKYLSFCQIVLPNICRMFESSGLYDREVDLHR